MAQLAILRFTLELPTKACPNKFDIPLNKPLLNVENTNENSKHIATIPD
jgi:hypothetical protein